MMLGLLLARAGVDLVVLEAHADFLRDFRGDTVHPSTLELFAELGIKERFDALPQQRVRHVKVLVDGELVPLVDFEGLEPFGYLSLVPQWEFLDFLASEAKRYPNFHLFMSTRGESLLFAGGRVNGVRAARETGPLRVEADLIVGCDGRNSKLRAQAGLEVTNLGAPMDVLWFRLPREATDPSDTFGVPTRGRLMLLLQREAYWQVGFVVSKAESTRIFEQPIEALRTAIVRRVPWLEARVQALEWADVKRLEVRVDRLKRWHRPGLLFIGDAAHAMSPIGGVGINLAIQDAVAAANALAPAFEQPGVPDESVLASIAKRRALPTRATQAVQVLIQRTVIEPALAWDDDGTTAMPPLARRLLAARSVRTLPARLFGLGVRREHVTPRLRGEPRGT